MEHNQMGPATPENIKDYQWKFKTHYIVEIFLNFSKFVNLKAIIKRKVSADWEQIIKVSTNYANSIN